MRDKVITILGLAARFCNLNGFEGEIWTLNDWYVESCYMHSPPFPQFNPTNVFQIHTAEIVEDESYYAEAKKHGRWTGDWREMYNKHAKHTVATYPISGINNIKLFDVEKARAQFGKWVLTSSVNYMLIQANWENAAYIRLNACPQVNEDYGYQMPGTYLLINMLRGMGIHIHNPYEMIWQERLAGFDWDGFTKIDCTYGGKHGLETMNFYGEHMKKKMADQLKLRKIG